MLDTKLLLGISEPKAHHSAFSIILTIIAS